MSPSIAVDFCFDQHHIEIKQPFSHAGVTVMRLAASVCFVGASVQWHYIIDIPCNKAQVFVHTNFNYLIIRIFLECQRIQLVHFSGIHRFVSSFYAAVF